MSSDTRINKTIAMFDNMNKTIRRAGGIEYSWEELQNMSVTDLIIRLGPNGVRFCNENEY